MFIQEQLVTIFLMFWCWISVKQTRIKKTESIFIIHDIFNWSKLRAIDNTKFGYSINQSTTSVILVTVHWFIQALNVQGYPLYAFFPYHITRQILYAYTIKSVLICFCNLWMISTSYLLVCDNQNFCIWLSNIMVNFKYRRCQRDN